MPDNDETKRLKKALCAEVNELRRLAAELRDGEAKPPVNELAECRAKAVGLGMAIRGMMTPGQANATGSR